ncbi:Ppx/GppA phosphatase family protein [Actinopolymorpha sp. B11F2]|uniref:Ppx/GppA phosphatase family protein n=1 Tax=Actinopolymorpha sp. B11F2 TaxID=3160862 RepID=UPI0032E3CCB6
MRVAAIDCGTNSIRLLIADVDAGPAESGSGRLVDVERRLEIVRLGQGVDRTGRFAAEALARTFDACRRYATLIDSSGAEQVRFVATSATRDAANREEFMTGVRDLLGVEPEVISGEEEARLSFAGATRELAGRGFPTPYLVVDIGGGSTEFVLGGTGDLPTVAGPQAAISVDLGCVRLTERCLPSDPPADAEIAAARAEVDRQLDKAGLTVPFEEARTLVGLAGTVTTVAAMALDLSSYDPDRLHHARIPATAVHAACARLLAMDHDERRRLPYMHPGRVDVIGGGSLILDGIAARVAPFLDHAEVVVSEHDILDGIAWSCVEASRS